MLASVKFWDFSVALARWRGTLTDFPQQLGTSNANHFLLQTQTSASTRKYHPAHLRPFVASPPLMSAVVVRHRNMRRRVRPLLCSVPMFCLDRILCRALTSPPSSTSIPLCWRRWRRGTSRWPWCCCKTGRTPPVPRTGSRRPYI